MRIGLVSDTHGKFEPRLRELFTGVDAVIHAGDVCGQNIIAALESFASVIAVSGNCDVGCSTSQLPAHVFIERATLCPFSIFITHDVGDPLHPKTSVAKLIEKHRPDIVVSGHSHQPKLTEAGTTLFVNPGSAGPRRFQLPKSAGVIEIKELTLRVTIFNLETFQPIAEQSFSLPKATE